MQITIYISKIYDEIRRKTQRDVASIESIEERYLIEAGTEKNDEIYADIILANDSLKGILQTFLIDCLVEQYDDMQQIPDAYVYELDLSPRRAVGKAQQLTDVMHDYLVHSTLMRFYDAVNGAELKAKHETAANAASIQLVNLLYTKARPQLV